MVGSKTRISIVVGSLILVVALLFLSPQRSYAQGGPGGAPTQDVNVVNVPIAVTDIDHQPIQPVFEGVSLNFVAGSFSTGAFFIIPEGKLFVVEMVTARIPLTDGDYPNFSISPQLEDLDGNPTPFPGSVAFDLGVTAIEVRPTGIIFYRYTHSVKIYSRNNLHVSITRNDNTTQTPNGRVALSGYLIDE